MLKHYEIGNMKRAIKNKAWEKKYEKRQVVIKIMKSTYQMSIKILCGRNVNNHYDKNILLKHYDIGNMTRVIKIL